MLFMICKDLMSSQRPTHPTLFTLTRFQTPTNQIQNMTPHIPTQIQIYFLIHIEETFRVYFDNKHFRV